MAESYKVGEAPWDLGDQPAPTTPTSFPAGQAPWEMEQPNAALPPGSPPAERFTGWESSLQGVGQGASLGYLPELQARLGAYLDPSSSYEKELASFRKREGDIQTEDPLAYTAGALAGGSTIPMPGVNYARAGGALARVGKMAAGGAGLGFAMNPGEAEGQLSARLGQAVTGGGLSGLAGGAGTVLEKSGRVLGKGREALAMKLAGGRKIHMKEFPAGTEKRASLVRFMEKENMLGPGSSYESVLDKASKIAKDTGGRLGRLYKSVTDDLVEVAKQSPEAAKELSKTRLNARRVAANILRNAKTEFKGKAGGREALNFLRKEVQNLADLDKTKIKAGFEMTGASTPKVGGLPVPVSKVPGVPGQIPPAGSAAPAEILEMSKVTRVTKETPFEGLLKYRQSLDDMINWQKKFGESKGNEKALKIARHTIDDMLNKRIQTIDRFAGTKRAQQLSPLKDRYQKASNLKRISYDRVAGEESKVNLGLLETIAGTGYAGAQISQGKDPVTALTQGLIGGLALRQARKYGPGLSYQALTKAQKAAGPLSKLGQVPAGGYIAPWLLMGQGAGK